MIDISRTAGRPSGYPNPCFKTTSRPNPRPQDSCGMAFIANIDNIASHSIIQDGLTILQNMEHRGASGADPTVGDGVGILVQIPDKFMRSVTKPLGIQLPERGEYAVGNFFFPKDEQAATECRKIVESVLDDHGIDVLGWRQTDVNSKCLSPAVSASEPLQMQLFVKRNLHKLPTLAMFDLKLFIARKVIFNRLHKEHLNHFYCSSFSSKTMVYKGMLLGNQLAEYFTDLQSPEMASSFAIVHQRFSTNTLPSWRLAHPYRMICHNGEINTLRGNVNWIQARYANMASEKLGEDVKHIWPIVADNQSDSGSFDNVLELLVQGGYSLAHAVMLLIPEAWENNQEMSPQRRALYEYHAALMEAWDGPAAVAFTDGRQIGATLDRNGLRPARYCITTDRRVIMASEAGPLPVAEDQIEQNLRLQPGRMLLVDLEQKRVIPDDEIKDELASAHPYENWVSQIQLRTDQLNQRVLPFNAASQSEHLAAQVISDASDVSADEHSKSSSAEGNDNAPAQSQGVCQEVQSNEANNEHSGTNFDSLSLQRAFAYTAEEIRTIIAPMVADAQEPIGAMGTDSPIAILSDRRPLLYDYFYQLFAQVTNPPIDPIRERMVMSLVTFLGPRPNVFHPEESAKHKRLQLDRPVLSRAELQSIKEVDTHWTGLESITIDITWPIEQGAAGLEIALNRVVGEAEAAVLKGTSIIILSDRLLSADKAAIPAMLAGSAVHHHLKGSGKRTLAGLVVESGEPREVHHFAMLMACGVDAVCPYLAFEVVEKWRGEYHRETMTPATAAERYVAALDKGLLKVMSRMGISTIQSYCGAQAFECVGLSDDVINKWFIGAHSQIGGATLEDIGYDAIERSRRGFGSDNQGIRVDALDSGGEYSWRFNGQRHAWTPQTVVQLRRAARGNSEEAWRSFQQMVDGQLLGVRSLWGLQLSSDNNQPQDKAVETVEATSEIVKRFSTGAMSFGALSREAHATLALAMNQIGGKSNSGEGGEEEDRLLPLDDGTSMRSAIKQVASGRFGVTAHYLCNADMIQIKMAQGAKPGEGGQLPGHKVDSVIASVRHATPGVGLISPPPHHDIYSIEDLAELIYDLKNINPRAAISVKLVSAPGVGTVAAGVAKARADHITISGFDGGTGASPLTSIKHAGSPWELGLAEAQQLLISCGLRSRVALQVDGGLRTGRDVVMGALLGADEFGFSTAPLIATGCLMMRKCHLNTCPVGIATQDPVLRARFQGLPEHVINYLFFVAEDVRRLVADLGFKNLNEIIGRSNLITALQERDIPTNVDETGFEISQTVIERARSLDFTKVLEPATVDRPEQRYHSSKQDLDLSNVLDVKLIDEAHLAIEHGEKLKLSMQINNSNRAVGAMLSNAINTKHGITGLEEDSIVVDFRGSAGQSFGAFAVNGITFRLHGECNDYVGKGLSGAKLIVAPPKEFRGNAANSVLVGNTVLYGATSGRCYFNGIAGERFAVRNSGAVAVVEGVGDHGCEYMTGGVVVVLGNTGRNFAAGMTGGIAYIWDPENTFSQNCNREMVDLVAVDQSSQPHELVQDDQFDVVMSGHHLSHFDALRLRTLVQLHADETGSERAQRILDNWSDEVQNFIKVLPRDYRHALMAGDLSEVGMQGSESTLTLDADSASANNNQSESREINVGSRV